MTLPPFTTLVRRVVAPLLLTGLFLALAAPTCTQSGTGTHTFSKGSLIIPMDGCYQGDPGATPFACPGARDPGKALYGYGLVYKLLQNNITVYWVIAPAKTSLTDVDLTVQFNAGMPVGKYSWTNGTHASPPPNNSGTVINYRGGPFVIDGADLPAVDALLQGSLKATFSPVNIHVSNVAFTGNVAKAMNGGWTAGGAVPPPIALLNIRGGDCKNSLNTVKQYLVAAGLGGVAGAEGTASGPHGSIYDVLDYGDFLPGLSTSNLGKNGYRILWAPHWVALNSCTGSCLGSPAACPAASKISTANVDAIINSIRDFVAGGSDVFSECASIGALEGDLNTCDTATIVQNTGAGRLTTTGGLNVNVSGWDYQCPGSMPSRTYYPNFVPLTYSQFSSPFLQIAEFPFSGTSGAVGNYRPLSTSAWRPGVQHLVTNVSPGDWDLFTVQPGTGGKGSTVYLGGHDYSGADYPLQIAGARFVLNTLFNLGSSCASTNAPCQTGLLGECGKGRMQCVNNAPACVALNQPATEGCDGLDNDCNGLVDDGLSRGCYGGPAATMGVGVCKGGTETCVNGAWGACQGEIKPSVEICNGLDDDCANGVDDGLAPQSCYGGPVGTLGVGLCAAGQQRCTSGRWGACTGDTRPAIEVCGDGLDNNCDGAMEEGCGCADGDLQPCYGGPPGTNGVGICHAGEQLCASRAWGACQKDQRPAVEICNGKDDDCNGRIDEGGVCDECRAGQTRPCYTGPAGTAGKGLCASGQQPCDQGKWGRCQTQVLPAPELCDGKDNDCNGAIDDGARCPPKQACVNGICVPGLCGGEIGGRCPEGYLCQFDACALGSCGAVRCPTGQQCVGGVCGDPCKDVKCGPGAICAGGQCTGGGCFVTGCPAGGRCSAGQCVTDSCASVSCPAATFCRAGFCVQSCAFLTCPAGKRCDADGLCADDPCAGAKCAAGEICALGACVADPCKDLGCGAGQVCQDARCVDDPCSLVKCPTGTCVAGQCYGGLKPDAGTPDSGRSQEGPDAASGEALDAGEGADADDGEPVRAAAAAPQGCGCSSGGEASPLAALLLLALGAGRGRRATAMLLAAALGGCSSAIPEAVSDGYVHCAADADCPRGARCGGGGLCRLPKDAGPDEFPVLPEVDAGPTCERCGGEACVVFDQDPLHCGRCETACRTAERCVDGACGPSTPVGPELLTITPAQAEQGAPVTIELGGARLQSGARLRVVANGVSSELSTTFLTALKLGASLDLTTASTGALELRVVNADRVISNARSFQVTAATPRVISLTPSQGTTAQVVAMKVTGSGFIAESLVKVSGPGLPETGLPTTYQSGTALACSFDLTRLQPGDYGVVVVNAGVLRSSPAKFTVLTVTPVLTKLSPSSGRPGAKISLAATGSGFDSTSVVEFKAAALPTTLVSGTQLSASPLDLAGVQPGTYDVRVVNGGSAASGTLPFTVTANAPQLNGMTPTSALQGAALTLDLFGTGFDATSVIHVFEPGNKDVPVATTLVSAGEVTGPYDLTGKPAGTYLVEVVNAGNLASNALPLPVQSNVATLISVSPGGGPQGATVTLGFTGDRFFTGGQLHVSGAGKPDTALATTVNSATSATVSGLSLAGWNTGIYSLTMVNPGATPSGAVGFTVFAGAPTLTSLSPTSATLGQVVTVTLTGTNFALPDASGAGGSSVHASAPSIGLTDAAIPATVVSSTKITVRLDTTETAPASYSITVWNPGGNPPPQKTSGLTFTVNP